MTDDVSLAPPAIETVGLTKRFGSHTAVDGIDLSVPRGSVFGFLGPNGSGKTTTIRMLLGLAGASAGEIRVLGEPMPRRVADVLPRVGALVEGPAFYPFLSGAANLARLDSANRHASSRTRRDRVAQSLERVGLSHAAGKSVKAYSLGMKQRLGLANALLTPRELLVLDEPTNGLDPQGTREVRTLIRSLAERRHDRVRLEPPARRDRADLHPRRRDERRRAGRAGHARRAAARGQPASRRPHSGCAAQPGACSPARARGG